MAPSSSLEPVRTVAVFDLDGTVTRRDTLGPYLAGWLRTHPGHAWRLWRAPLSVLRYVAGASDRGHLKASLIRQAMAGATRDEVTGWSRSFAAHVARDLVCPGARECIRQHRERGDYLVLLSASVDLYVPDIASELGFDEAICTGLRWQGDRLDGALTTANRRGDEKRRCLEELRRRFPQARFHAYANAGSDFAHLLQADAPLLVNAGQATRRRAERAGLRSADWR
jgi:HAD superfamily hydrolase (TIGR01490 family)